MPEMFGIPRNRKRLLQPNNIGRFCGLVGLFAGLLCMGGCQSGTTSGPRGPVTTEAPIQVVTTTSMIADLVRVIGQPYVAVDGLMGPNVDPHLYKASEGDVRLMSSADVVVYNGLHLEGKMVDIFEQMKARNLAVYAITDAFTADELLESSYFAGNHDPHFWFDVKMWKKAASNVAAILATFDPPHASQYAENLNRYQALLDSTHQEIMAQVQQIPPDLRVLVTSHDAFGYFGRAYGMEVKGLQGLSTATEAGTADVQDLATFVAEHKIPSIFIESSISPRGIEAVREAVRSKGFEVQIGGTLYGDALGSPGSDADTYVKMVLTNARTLVSGLAPVNN